MIPFNPKRAGLFGPISPPGGGGFRPPLVSRKRIDELSCVWYQWIAMTLPSPFIPKKVQTYLVWRHSDVKHDVMQKCEKSQKIAKFMVFRHFFKQKLDFLAMMCVKVCAHMLLLQINQINKIKHSVTVSWKQKTGFLLLCVISMGNRFSSHPVRDYVTPRRNRRSDFVQNGLKSSARLQRKKSCSFSVKK